MNRVNPSCGIAASSFLAAVFSSMLVGEVRASDWVVQKESSSLRFTGVTQGESFEGRFGEFDAMISFDPAALSSSKFDVNISLASADSKNEERDGTLHGADFFDVAQYPKARFVATEFVPVKDGFEALGALEMRGVRQPATLTFGWTVIEGGARLEGRATLDRTDFGVGGGDWEDAEMIGHEVKVATTLVLKPSG